MKILITGGTGSIGRALIERLLPLSWVEKLCIYSRDEHKQEQVREQFNDNEKLRYFIGDVRDFDRLSLALRNINLIIHAAALKIVPTAEYNPFETIKTNIVGSQNVCLAAINNKGINFGYMATNHPKVLLLSTDKAVRPINLYGATKLCAEKLFISSNNILGPAGPTFSVARYGNVANSNGSVIQKFKQQAEKGEQLKITDDKMTRFWITISEAAEFIIKCAEHMQGGETFVPAMPSFRIKDLALVMMKDYPLEKQWVRVIGIRKGEKLYEEIITPEEFRGCDFDQDRGMFVINPPKSEAHKRDLSDQALRIVTDGLNSDSEPVPKLGQPELYEKLKDLGVIE